MTNITGNCSTAFKPNWKLYPDCGAPVGEKAKAAGSASQNANENTIEYYLNKAEEYVKEEKYEAGKREMEEGMWKRILSARSI